jgi:hypothetical protein
VYENRSVATTVSAPPRLRIQTTFWAPPAWRVTVALLPSSTLISAGVTEKALPGCTRGPTSVCRGFWFSYCSFTQSAERATLEMRTSSMSPTN